MLVRPIWREACLSMLIKVLVLLCVEDLLQKMCKKIQKILKLPASVT